MKLSFLLFSLKIILLKIYPILNFKKNKKKLYKNENKLFNGVYQITSLSNNFDFNIKNNFLILLNKQSNFRLLKTNLNEYYIEYINNNKRLTLDNNNKIKLYDSKQIIKEEKMIWNIINININEFLIQNKFSSKFIEALTSKVICNKNINYLLYNGHEASLIDKRFKFKFLKLYEENKYIDKNILKIVRVEPIDVIIKYIDLTDKNLKRIGIKQIYKDHDNEELRYSIRSILEYIPWIRKIYIIMPNLKIKFFKSLEEIEDKIKYIKDSDLLGFDSANIFSFTFNLYKLEKFNVTKNFLYMEDDFFIGKPLKKKDFFYYDEIKKKIFPYLLTKYFNEMNKTQILDEYTRLFNIKNSINPHSRLGWWLSIYSTDKYFIEKYKPPLIDTLFTHNVIAKNLDDLKEIFEEIKKYEYINETLFSKERHILTLNQPHFFNIYQLNVKHKKVHSIPYKYIEIESIKNKKQYLNFPLFVINTGGNHIPLNRQYKIQKKYMSKKYFFKNIYEINDENTINRKFKIERLCYFLSKIVIIVMNIKIFIILIY